MWRLYRAPDNPQQRIIADRQHQALGKAGGRPPTKRQLITMDDMLHPRRAPGAGTQNLIGKAFCKDLLAAQKSVTSQAANSQMQTDQSTG